MRRLREQFSDTLVVIGVHSAKFPAEQLTENIRAAVMRHGIEHPVVNDAQFQVWQSYAVRAWPTIALVDTRGYVVYTQSGEILAEELAPRIQTLLDAAAARNELQPGRLELYAEQAQEPLRPLRFPSKLLVTQTGRLFVADTGHQRVLEFQLSDDARSAELLRVFGNGQPGLRDGPAETAQFQHPHGLALEAETLYVADTDNHAIRAINLNDATVRTIAGTGQKAHGSFALGEPTETPLRSPWAVLVQEGIVFIAMAGSHQIWVLLQASAERPAALGPFAGNSREALIDGPRGEASFNQPSDLAFGADYLFVADAEAGAIRAISFDAEPQVFTLVGQGLFEFGDIDGQGAEVRLQHPTGLALIWRRLDDDPNRAMPVLLIADTYNNKIKLLDPSSGMVQTLVGSGNPGNADGAVLQAELFEPEGLATHNGRIFIADTNNHLVRVADLQRNLVYTLELRGLERMPTVSHTAAEALRLPALQVASGPVTLELEVLLPAGYKLNEQAPLLLRSGSQSLSFQPGELPRLELQISDAQELALDLTIYYCEADDERLCLIHQVNLLLPLSPVEGAPARLRLRYPIE